MQKIHQSRRPNLEKLVYKILQSRSLAVKILLKTFKQTGKALEITCTIPRKHFVVTERHSSQWRNLLSLPIALKAMPNALKPMPNLAYMRPNQYGWVLPNLLLFKPTRQGASKWVPRLFYSSDFDGF